MMPSKSKTAPADAPMPNAAPTGPDISDWNLLRSFMAIYETGTLTKAAERLRTTQPSMGRHLRDLEAAVREPLFARLPGRLKATSRAEQLYESLLGMRLAEKQAQSVFSGTAQQLQGVVRVAVSEAYAYHVIPAMLLPLLSQYSQLEIELSVSNKTDNLLRRDADIAVRFFRPEQNDVIAVKVGQTELGMFAHRDLLERQGTPEGINPSPTMVLAGNDREVIALQKFIVGERPEQTPRFRFRTDFVLAREAAVISGHAIGMMFTDIAKQYPQLQQVLTKQVTRPQEVWLCAHEELKRSQTMRTVWDALESGLKARFNRA